MEGAALPALPAAKTLQAGLSAPSTRETDGAL